MTDLQSGRFDLADAVGLVACGGFSYGDTLGAGEGWARSVLFNERLTESFHAFFHRDDTFGLGICNGCQMFAALADLVPGAEAWPRFTRNRSEQYEARLTLVEVLDSPSVLMRGMEGSRIPIAVAHGEGFADFSARGRRRRRRPGRPLRRPPRPARDYLPAQPQRVARRAHRGHDARRPVHRDDAAPRAGPADRADVLDVEPGGRGEPVAADVPQRPGVGRLMVRVLRAEDVDTTTFTQTQFREGYDEREVDDLLEDVAATLRRYESGSPAARFRMDSTGIASVRFTPTRLRRGYDHEEVDAFLADVVHTLEHHEARGALPATDAGTAGPAGPAGAPAADRSQPAVVVERESWRARLVRILRGEDG